MQQKQLEQDNSMVEHRLALLHHKASAFEAVSFEAISAVILQHP